MAYTRREKAGESGMTTQMAKELADRYKAVLRNSDDKLFDDAPEQVQASLLALHQHATMYWWYERRIDRLLSWEEWKAAGSRSSNKRFSLGSC